MKVDVLNQCPDYGSYRAARVKSMFNVTSGAEVHVTADLPLDNFGDWSIGLVVGPSGSGKTTIGKAIWEGAAFYEPGVGWPEDAPIVDTVSEGDDADFDSVTGALAAVGLGDVPAWLRPYHVLSMGERFRADLARIICTAPERVVFDEFTSVVDRQIAKVGANAFAKSWRRGKGQAILLSCHYDIIDWLAPDWIWDTATKTFADTRGSLCRPDINLEIVGVSEKIWPLFKPHHYLDSAPMPFSVGYMALVDGDPVAHLGVSSKHIKTKKGGRLEARACRMVVMPEWQGAGVGMKFLNHVCQMYLETGGHLKTSGVKGCTTQFHTSHPGLVMALRRDRRWRQVSAITHGNNKNKSRASIAKAQSRANTSGGGYGGHFRAVQGFRYMGEPVAA